MTIQEKNPQRGQRGGGGRLTPVTSLQAAARGEPGPSPQPPVPAPVELVSPRAPCPVSPTGDTAAHGALRPPSTMGAAPASGKDEPSEVSTRLPADKMLSRRLPPKTPFGSCCGRGVSGAGSGRTVPSLPAEEEPCRGRLSTSRLPAPAQIVPTRG